MRAMKGVDDFLWVLLAAGVFMVIIAMYTVYFPPRPTDDFKILESLGVGSVGFSAETPARTILLGDFVVGEPQSETMKALSRVEVSRGWTGADERTFEVNVPQWVLSEKRKAVVSFDVYDTNAYAPLIVEWNGKRFYYDRADRKKHYDVEVPKDYVMATNTLRLDADGPGLMFWASTYYDLRGIKASVVMGPSKLLSFDMLPEELEAFDHGTMEFYATGSSPFAIKVNGIEFYAGTPSGRTTITFDFRNATLRRGQNIMSISSGGVVNAFGGVMRLYTLTGQGKSLQRFNITAEDYKLLRDAHGSVRLLVDDVVREGVLGIALNGKGLMETRPAEGWNNVSFSAAEAKEGTNELLITATGEFEISRADVGIER